MNICFFAIDAHLLSFLLLATSTAFSGIYRHQNERRTISRILFAEYPDILAEFLDALQNEQGKIKTS